MSIKIGNYNAEGPFHFSNIDSLKPRSATSYIQASHTSFRNANNLRTLSGVYVILGRNSADEKWNIIDIGESENVRERVSNHDREPCWRSQGYFDLGVAVIYANEQKRLRIESELRKKQNPPCGSH